MVTGFTGSIEPAIADSIDPDPVEAARGRRETLIVAVATPMILIDWPL